MTKFALDKGVITAVVITIIMLAGASAFRTLPRDEDPGFTIRTALVTTYFPGASPKRVENLVTDKIEEVVQEIPEIDFVSSESRTGVSLVFVNIQQRYKDMRPIWDNLRRKVDRAVPHLPEDVIGPMVDDEFGDVFGILFTLTGEGYSYAELEDVAEEVRDELLRIEDAAKVEIFGAQEERVFVEFNSARLAELNLSVGQLQQILEGRNIVVPGGSVRVGDERVTLEPSGNFETVDDLKRTVIKLPGRPDLVFLEDIASIARGYIDPPRTIVHSSGATALAIGISMREGGNVLSLGEQVQSTMARLQGLYPIGVEFDLIADQPQRVEKKFSEFTRSLVQAIAIVVVIMLFSLGLRTGLVVATLIPATLLATLMIMGFWGIGLDQMSLAALIIALGMLIDNAIVMSESIIVQMRDGKAAVRAAIDSATELRVPLLISSLTTSAAFLPIYLAKSSVGEYTGVIFVVVTLTLLCSWVLALTLTPLMCVKFLKVKGKAESESYNSRFYRAYRTLLLGGLRRPWRSLAAAVVIFVGVMQLAALVPNIFFPKADRPFFTAELDLPIGTDILVTEQMVSDIEDFIARELEVSPERPDGITHWASFVGGGEPLYILTMTAAQPKPSYAYMLFNTVDYRHVPRLIEKLERHCKENYPDLVATILPSSLGPPVTKPIEVRISGKDASVIFGVVRRVKEKLATIAGTLNIDDNWGRRTKKLIVEVNGPRARRAGVTSRDVAISLQSQLSGVQTTEFREDNEVIPVTLRSVAADREDIGKIESLNIYSQTTGRPVPLKQVADVHIEWEASKILRRDRQKTVTIECDLEPAVTASSVNAVLIPWLEQTSAAWAIGYGYELGGEIESSIEANESIGAQLPVALLVIILLLVVQFNSIRKPIIILATLPMSMVGVVIGLLVFRSVFGFMTLLGVVSLAGIVINNAIVLLDRIRIEIDEHGRSPQHAILEAAQRRLRPILLTTMTTIGGLVPLYLGGGPMWEPMAVAIMAGLFFATVLTLGLVPVLYAVFFRVSYRGFEPE